MANKKVAALHEQMTEQAEELKGLIKERDSHVENGAAAAKMISQLEEELSEQRAKVEELQAEQSQQEQRAALGVKAIASLERELDEKRDQLSAMELLLADSRRAKRSLLGGATEPRAQGETARERATILA